MTTALTRVVIFAPIALIAFAAFAVALLIEWSGDLMRTCPDSEKLS